MFSKIEAIFDRINMIFRIDRIRQRGLSILSILKIPSILVKFI